MAERLSHFSGEGTLEPYSQTQRDTPRPKPDGLWVSVDGPQSWVRWCRDERWGLEGLKHRFRVVLRPDAPVLRIKDDVELHRFTRKYGEAHVFHGLGIADTTAYYEIRWQEVAAEYHGIVIAPYQWSCRLDSNTSWYYGWDCASGCVWDVEAIAEVRPFKRRVATGRP